MSHRKWRETKQQPSRATSGHKICCCLVSLHFLCDILSTHTALYLFFSEKLSCTMRNVTSHIKTFALRVASREIRFLLEVGVRREREGGGRKGALFSRKLSALFPRVTPPTSRSSAAFRICRKQKRRKAKLHSLSSFHPLVNHVLVVG